MAKTNRSDDENNPDYRLTPKDQQERLDISMGRKIPNWDLDMKEERASTTVYGDISFNKPSKTEFGHIK
jgi:hypothetical protein